jgi:hypothetical protein
MIFSVDFGEAAIGVGHHFIQLKGSFVGARITDGISARREAGDVQVSVVPPISAAVIY